MGTFLLLCVLIESDWNLKYKDTASAFPTGKSINRIRLEFKEKTFKIINKLIYSINRIRLEFKGVQKSMKTRQVEVLIESDWNLKDAGLQKEKGRRYVLIESDWNLKLIN